MIDGLNIRGTVALASSDNLGSCYIGGYKPLLVHFVSVVIVWPPPVT